MAKTKRSGRSQGARRNGKTHMGRPGEGHRRAPHSPLVHGTASGSQSPFPSRPFSLQEEARNTGHTQTFWSSPLRHNRINFVSAGDFDANKLADMETSKEASSPESGQANFQSEPEAEAGNLLAEMSLEPKPEGSSNTSRKQHSEVRDGMKDVSTDVEEDGVVANFVTDVIGSGAMPQTRFSPPRIRASSPTPSDSSEEVVLFQGRIAPAVLTVSDHSTINFPHSQTSAKPQLQRKPDGIASASKVAAPRRESQWGSRGSTSGRSRGDDVLADYIANMQENGYLDEQITDAEQEPNEIGHPNEPKGMYDNLACNDPVGEKKLTHGIPHHDWSDLDLKDFNEFSTSESVLGHVQEIISKRYRESGPQYLVIWEGSTVDDARWVSSASLTMEGAAAQIAAFEKIYRNTEEISESEDELEQIQGDESEESDELSGEDEEEDLLDNQDLIERKLERMTDEKLARLLSKQEELGMGSNELLLFDDGEENEENIGLQNFSDVSGIGRTKRSRQTSRISGRRQVGFPSASALAAAFEDDYGDFDIMDRERASIVTKPKHRNQVLPFQLSDSELEATLKSNWDNDRKKKRARKAEREELRAQGLIGSKGKNKSNLRVKYDQGMTLEDVRKELGEFLDSERDSLSLPPLDKRDRKIVHEIANSVGLKSKSTGSGSNRFPILYKTSKSDFFEDSDLDVVIARLKQRRFLPRLDKRSKKGTGPARRSGGVAHLGVSYRDGDVVGASAPELGVENKGRAMLEKMGWSTGTALGALNNKGILQPVVHVVKTSKAGLG